MDHRNITETYVRGVGIRLLLSRHNHTPILSMYKEIRISLKKNDVCHPLSFQRLLIGVQMKTQKNSL